MKRKCEHTNLESQQELIDPGMSGFKDLHTSILIKSRLNKFLVQDREQMLFKKQFKGTIKP